MVLNILHLEDSEKDSELIRSTLEADGFECHVSRVENRKDLERSLERSAFDLILADYKLPSFDGISAIKIAREKSPNIPVILVSGTLGEEKAVEAIKQGAADYLLKQNLTRLGFAVRSALQHAEEMKKRKQAEEISSQETDFSQAVIDSLPGLFYLFDEQGKFLRWNKNFEHVSRYSTEEISSLSPLDLFDEPDKGIIAERIKEVFSKGEATVEADFLSKDKIRTPYFFTGKLFSFKGKPSVIGMGIDVTERKRAEEELRKLSSAVEQIADSLVITNKDGIIEYVNPAFEALTGYRMEEVLGKTPRILKSGKQDQKYYEELWGTILAGRVFRAVIVNKKKNGELYYGEETITPIVNTNGNITHFVSSDKNITERKRTEEALRNAEARYRVLFEQSPNGVLLIETETGKTIEANETTYKQLGYTREEFSTLRISDYEALEKPEETAKHMQKVIREGNDNFETLHRTKTGEIRNVHVWAKILRLGERVLFHVVFQDITERKKAEKGLKLFRTLIDQTSDAIEVVDPETGRYLDVNEKACLESGYSRGELLGLSVFQIDPTVDKTSFTSAVEDLRKLGALLWEGSHRRKDGSTYPVEVNMKYVQLDRDYIVTVVRDITERKRAEERLAASENRLNTIIEAEPECVKVVAADGTLLSMNPAGLRMIEADSSDQVIGKSVYPLVVSEYRQAFQDMTQRVCRGAEGTLQFEIVGMKGTQRWLDTHAVPLRDEKGHVSGMLGISRDITGRKRVEIALRESESRFRSVWEKSADGMRITNEEGLVILVNDAYCKMVEKPREEIEGNPMSIVYEEAKQAEVLRKHQERFRSRKIPAYLEREIVLWNGKKIFLDLSNTFLENPNQPTLLLSAFRDITERKLAEEASKRAEEALKESKEHYRKFFEDDLTGDYVSTPDGRILSCNPAYVRIFGFASIEDALNTNASTLVANPERRERFLSLMHEKKKLEYYETEYIRRDGTTVYGVENAIGVFDAQGDLVQIRGYLFDDTRRKLLEQQLLRAQKLESLGTLAGGIAHDFNNILGIILGHSTLLERFTEDPQKLSESIKAITKASERGASLVKQLLTFARKTEALFESVSINDMIREINKLLRETFPKTITISTSLQQDLPAIVADASQIHQVLLNLCVNARDAMPQRGTLSISTRTIEGEAVSSRFPKATEYPMARQYVQIEVADTGIGMDETTRQRIFEPFFTTKAPGKGTGLGLAVVFGIIESHTGFIDVRSVPGEGTSFTVYLPIREHAPEVPQRARKNVEEITGGREAILVIEDEEMLRNLAKAILVSKGYTVLTAEDGMQGVDMYQSHQKEIAVVLSDIGLPILSGQDVFRKIREINPKAKVIMASGFIDPETKSEMYKAGLKNFIQKPYLHDEVLQKIREVIDSNG